ncbi:hypothetical protein [Leeuwenhoekiella sp. H156]|uniref:hypothetical protein n=1 Tax=Leeuwenhoekiella sp. H156 TaxID=3450128 RepID=UPI003FA42D03
MKYSLPILLVCISSLLISKTGFAQTYKDERTDAKKVQDKEISNPALLMALGVDFNPNVAFQNIKGNSVFLTQIGEYNKVQIATRTENSEINLTQEGNFNSALLNYTARTAFADLVQNGDYNAIEDRVYKPGETISLELTQNGDYLNFKRENVNQLTKSMKFTQTNASPSLIIRSFN